MSTLLRHSGRMAVPVGLSWSAVSVVVHAASVRPPVAGSVASGSAVAVGAVVVSVLAVGSAVTSGVSAVSGATVELVSAAWAYSPLVSLSVVGVAEPPASSPRLGVLIPMPT